MTHGFFQPLARCSRIFSRCGFTLIELLTVCGVIVILLGTVGLALGGRGGEGASLAAAQNELSGLVSSARAQAALHQTTARLLVYAQPPPTGDANKYLRQLQVVRQETTTTGATLWVAAGDPVILPGNICIVPPSPVAASHLNTGVTWNNNAATGPVSIFSPTILNAFLVNGQGVGTGRAVAGQLFGGTGGGRAYYLEFAPDGTVTSNATSNPTKIALTTAVLAPATLPKFNNASAVRGVVIRKSGAIARVNDATGF